MAETMSVEDGVQGAVDAFHKHLPKGYDPKEPYAPWMVPPRAADDPQTGCCGLRSW